MKRLMKCLIVSLLSLFSVAYADTKIFYDNQVNAYSISIFDAGLNPDNSRTDAEASLVKTLIGIKTDGTSEILSWDMVLTKVSGDTNGNYTVSVGVPASASDTYKSVFCGIRLTDTGYNITRNWEIIDWADTCPSVAEIDAQLISSHGSGYWTTATASGSNTVIFTVTDSDTSLAIPSCSIEAWNSGRTVVLDRKDTDTNGIAYFYLDNGTYDFIFRKMPNYVSSEIDNQLVDSNPEAIAKSLTPFAPTAPTDPDLCTVYGWVYNATGSAISGIKIKAQLNDANIFDVPGHLVSRIYVTTTTDSSGYFELPLIKSTSLVPSGSEYNINIKAAGYNQDVSVPDASSSNLKDLD